ncbi:MAG TPA: hypoxanthine phosphoribosyltransferase [Verrucomicrobiota bacterium]|jgi:hypoxanthine phosphoribosyltransferase|nr:hypoxanthine phosphoribosyltransferase [Verrucomicrobiota bacterium]
MSNPNADIAKILVSEEEIQRRIRELALRVQSDFSGRDLVVVGLLTGTLMFLADLVREIDLPLRLDFIGVSSYRDGTESRELVFTKELRLDVAGRDVLLVDDILDTGKTLRAVIDKLDGMTPRQVRTCVLLSKKARREYDIPADYVGFEIPDEFVVGYGLDYAEKYRNLPSIGLLKPELYS